MPLKKKSNKPITTKKEQLYIFVDKSGHCFDDFAGTTDETNYYRVVATMLKNRKFSVGDMLAFRDDLTATGFEWGKDFYVKKERQTNSPLSDG